MFGYHYFSLVTNYFVTNCYKDFFVTNYFSLVTNFSLEVKSWIEDGHFIVEKHLTHFW